MSPEQIPIDLEGTASDEAATDPAAPRVMDGAQCTHCRAVFAGRSSYHTPDLTRCLCTWCLSPVQAWRGMATPCSESIPGQRTYFAWFFSFLTALPAWPTHLPRAELARRRADHDAGVTP